MIEITEPIRGKTILNLCISNSTGDIWIEFSDDSILHIEGCPETLLAICFNKSKHNSVGDAKVLFDYVRDRPLPTIASIEVLQKD